MSQKIGKRKKGKSPRKLFDLIIYGATSDMGWRLSEYIARYIPSSQLKSWAIADTNTIKLSRLHLYLEPFNQPGQEEIGVYSINRTLTTTLNLNNNNNNININNNNNNNNINNNNNKELKDFYQEEERKLFYSSNLEEMCQKTVIIINCSSNIRDAETIIEYCIQFNVDYIDTLSDIHFVNSIYTKYHSLAKYSGVLLSPGCSWTSVFGEIGFNCASDVVENNENYENSPLKLTKVRSFINLNTPTKISNQLSILNSMRSVITPIDQSKSIVVKNKYRGIFYFDEDISQWVIPTPSSDSFFLLKNIYERGMRVEKEDAPQIDSFLATDSFFYALFVYLVLLFVFFLSKIAIIHRYICYYVSTKSDIKVDSREHGQQIIQCNYINTASNHLNNINMNINQKYDDNKDSDAINDINNLNNLNNGSEQKNSDESNKEVRTYSSLLTSANSLNQIAITSCLLCLLLDRMSIVSEGGCLTPATAFGKHLLPKLKMLGVDITSGEIRCNSYSSGNNSSFFGL